MEQLTYESDTNNSHCRELLDILLAKGIEEIVLSPGSRNTPLLIGTACRPFRRHVITDEREAAFFALGLAIESQRPVAIICTSGTALYNYSPAVAEAFYQKVPLIVISADRPLEWIDQDDSQTLRQPSALANIVKGSFDIPSERGKDEETSWYVNRTINEACNLALSDIHGPVHINVRLDNPLNHTIHYTPGNPRIVENISNHILPHHIITRLGEQLRGRKIMIVVGFLPPDNALNRVLSDINNLNSVKIFAETLSNLHINGDICCIDTLLDHLPYNNPNKMELLRPDIIISIGGALVSRRLKNYLRSIRPVEHWTLGDTSPNVDCFRTLTKHINIEPLHFFRAIKRYISNSNATDYAKAWSEITHIAQENNKKFLQEHHSDWCELRIFDEILHRLPSKWNLFLSNGTPVRYAQLFTSRLPHASYSNRGVSGIDGTTSTAIGLATNYSGETLLITGDTSFSYDPGSLGIKSAPQRLKIIVINNQGGGIFRFIPSTKHLQQREELFCSDPKTPIHSLAEAWGWEYGFADNFSSLNHQLNLLLKSSTKYILEIKVDGEQSAQILSEFLNEK